MRLRSEVASWDGTPHRWGGTSRSGADCSGFVMTLYDELFGVALPRTTDRQADVGTTVERRSLAAGDLVFFRLSPRERHVGVYLGNGEFAHASSSRGVRVSSLTDRYWNERYWTSRRVLDGSTQVAMSDQARLLVRPSVVHSNTREKEAPEPNRRVGW